MKKQLLFFLLTLSSLNCAYGMEKFRHLGKLPANSLIRQRCAAEGSREYRFWQFKTKNCNACQLLNLNLEAYENLDTWRLAKTWEDWRKFREWKKSRLWSMWSSDSVQREAMRTILANQSDKVKLKEYEEYRKVGGDLWEQHQAREEEMKRKEKEAIRNSWEKF